jgi:hypothetical protein
MTFSKDCHLCSSKILGQKSVCCITCDAYFHQKCLKKDSEIPRDCPGMGSIRIKIQTETDVVLPYNYYEPLIDILQWDDFGFPHALGNVSHKRDEIAQALIKIFNAAGLTMTYLQAMIKKELVQTSDAQTLFRANSMTSKSIDAYMKSHGSRMFFSRLIAQLNLNQSIEFLRMVLQPCLQDIIFSNRPCEVIFFQDKRLKSLIRPKHN